MKRQVIPGVIDGKQALCCVPPEATAHEATLIMLERRVGAAMVVEGGSLKGIVTKRDVVIRLLVEMRDARATSLVEIMIRDLYEAVRVMLEEELRSAESLIYGEQYGAAAT